MKIERMAEQEFISELLFLVVRNDILDLNQTMLDELYKEYENTDLNQHIIGFNQITEFLIALELDYSRLKKLNWLTHLYGLFSVGWYCVNKQINAASINKKLAELYAEYFSHKPTTSEYLLNYKASCSSRTRSKGQRVKRLKAILGYCGLKLDR